MLKLLLLSGFFFLDYKAQKNLRENKYEHVEVYLNESSLQDVVFTFLMSNGENLANIITKHLNAVQSALEVFNFENENVALCWIQRSHKLRPEHLKKCSNLNTKIINTIGEPIMRTCIQKEDKLTDCIKKIPRIIFENLGNIQNSIIQLPYNDYLELQDQSCFSALAKEFRVSTQFVKKCAMQRQIQ